VFRWVIPVSGHFKNLLAIVPPIRQLAGESLSQKWRTDRPELVFAYPIDATFIRADLDLMNTFCDVVPIHFTGPSMYPSLLRAISETDLVVTWFALEFSAVANLAAKALGKGSVLMAGGWDVVGIPEINYGRLLTLRGRVSSRVALSSADSVLAFSDWSAAQIRRLVPNARVRRTYLGVDTSRFVPGTKERLVVCVAHVSRENISRKGLRDFVKAASHVPDARFILVGKHWDGSVDELRRLAGENVEFPGRLSDTELRNLLARAKVYVQPSYTEGFGLAVVEAMSAGCVPVVTESGALAEVVGDAGYLVRYGEVEEIAAAIRGALDSPTKVGPRRRVEERFTLDQRARELRGLIMELWRKIVNPSRFPAQGSGQGST